MVSSLQDFQFLRCRWHYARRLLVVVVPAFALPIALFAVSDATSAASSTVVLALVRHVELALIVSNTHLNVQEVDTAS